MDRLVRGLFLGTLAAAALAGEAASAPASAIAPSLNGSSAPGDAAWRYCTDTARRIERKDLLPQSMLEAITTVETGKAAEGEMIARPWPWTVTAEGKGQYYPTKKAAIEAVRALRARGVESVDVGCMQVNLHYHPGAFTSLDEAFEPASNITYAASLLKNLRNTEGSWETAIEHYHSYDPELRHAYRLRVFASWQNITNDRNAFRLASEVSLEPLGTLGAPARLEGGLPVEEAPLTGATLARHRAPSVLDGPVVRLASLDPPGPADEEPAHAAPMVVIAVDLRPRASDRPDPTEASVFGRTAVAVADPAAAHPVRD
jgi:hypothetical protein